jgi:hypothetical protein
MSALQKLYEGRADVELELVLEDGTAVYVSLLQFVADLLARGYLITVTDDGEVRTLPRLDEDVLFILQSCWISTAAILRFWSRGASADRVH